MLNAAEQAEADAAAHRDTPEKKRQRIAELEERARLFGDPVKQSTQAKVDRLLPSPKAQTPTDTDFAQAWPSAKPRPSPQAQT